MIVLTTTGIVDVLQEIVKQRGRRKNRLIVQDLAMALSPAKDLQPLGIEAMPYDFFTPQPVKGEGTPLDLD